MFFVFSGVLIILCENSLKCMDFLEELRDFDLIIYDNVVYCGVLMGEFFDVLRVEIMFLFLIIQLFFLYYMIFMLVFYVLQGFIGFFDKMIFVECVMNLVVFFGWCFFDFLVCGREMNVLKIKYNIKFE